jgi:hypothetical protein
LIFNQKIQKMILQLISISNIWENRHLIVILILAILPYTYYSTLSSPYNNYEYHSNSIFFTTWHDMYLGSFNLYFMPLNYIIYLSSLLIGSTLVTQLYHIMLVVTAAITSYFFILYITKNKNISFLISLFYIYGIYGQFVSFWDPTNLLWAILPWISLVVLRVSIKRSFWRDSALIGFILLLLIGSNLTFVAYLILFLFFLVMYKFISESKEVGIKTFKVVLMGGIFGLLLSSIFYLTFFSQFFYQSTFIQQSLALETPEWKSSASWLHELYREMGSLSYYYYFKGWSYPQAQTFITNKFIIAVSYLLPLLLLTSLIVVFNKKNRSKLFWILLILLPSFFMAMGVFQYSPTRDIYYWFFNHIPYFAVFRDPYKIMLFVHFLFAITLAILLYDLKNQKKIFLYRTLSIVIVSSTLILSFQYWTGTFYTHEEIHIPDYWIKFGDYYSTFDRQAYRTMLFPELPFSVYNFTGIRGKHTVFFRPFLDNKVVYRQSGSVYDDFIVNDIYATFRKNITCFQTLSARAGIKYFLNQYDQDYKMYDGRYTETSWIGLSPEEVDAIFKNATHISLLREFNNIRFYELSGLDIYPDIFFPRKIIFTNNSRDYCKYSDANGRIIWVNNRTIASESITVPTSRVHKVNNAIFDVEIIPFHGQAVIVLNHRWDNGWKIFKTSSNTHFITVLLFLFQKPVYDHQHFLANGFANAWMISDPQATTEHYTIIYMPQVYFSWSLILSGVTLFIVLWILLSPKSMRASSRRKKE